jgi:hypothetical protein
MRAIEVSQDNRAARFHGVSRSTGARHVEYLHR